MKYNHYIKLSWATSALMLFTKHLEHGPILEILLFSLSVILVLYLFFTVICEPLFIKAIKNKNQLLFIVQALGISSIESLLLICVFYLFSFLESIGIFPISDVMETLSVFNIGNWTEMFVTAIVFNFGFCGLRFYKHNMELQKTLVESQLQILQAQINPHFMFNVLNHINILMHKDVELASSLLLKYSEILRYQLYSGKKKQITVHEEVQFLKSFIEVEKMRWKDNLDVACSWNIENDRVELPPLLFITFVENAFKHVSRSHFEKGYIRIDFSQNGNQIQLKIENSKSTIKKDRKCDSGLGLANIKNRLDILYPKKHLLTIKDDNLVYYSALTITI